ncbi:phosphoribosylaminoimidazole-succinocarboxamide synthase [Quadrisphaera granulorum]|uniref:Phosphoribosylaminoimidazole-succinocarboxamide synthase n=1 Tax=Quadrisphaera granulorum TaxID=317664 RepID=A0A316AFZ2_9ACTN|nr:phosphoribosylaminoimidazolesuccinocarboxamide synthase [Quadrisphaera granulorum]PWJ55890.1 phosphoribosylaminoimidazole-succinocarboxamide synthase [Quadrisphaera granulorum]SZE95387.1 phosphoribosylaminoimidazole-succinocarboxamide synthase [Quadrisphaera granulorum]
MSTPETDAASARDLPQELPGWSPLHAGKVRQLYAAHDDPSRLLLVVSDRISAYDHVLATPIPDKGALLTALSLWWFEQLEDWGLVRHHVVGAGAEHGVPGQVAGRAMVVRRLEMLPVECIARGYLTGSGLAEYRATGSLAGVELPPGLEDGDRLRAPLFTPTTKAAVGLHDEPINEAGVAALVGAERGAQLKQVTVELYSRGAAVAAERGVLLADTKVEFGLDPDGDPADPASLVLGDELLTPDSSRFWPADGWQPGRAQPSFDKQYVRDWLTSPASGWSRISTEPPPPLPDDVVERTRARYVEAYERLTGRRWQ